MGTEEGGKEGFGIGVKLPESNGLALSLPFTEPSGYGLGKSGWVSVKFLPGELPPAQMLKEWIEESYRAVAPKKLVAGLEGGKALEGAAAKPKKKAAKKTAKTAKRAAKG